MVRTYNAKSRQRINIGSTYGRLTVLSFSGRNPHGNLLWNCKCSCGVDKTVTGSNLLGGTNPSCGCWKSEELKQRNTTHGLSNLPEYSIWLGIKGRCLCKTMHDYKSYGGRGITLCKRWLVFENFIKDVGARPTNLHTIERIDNNGGYYQSNCQWVTRKVQARNKSNVPLFEYNGQYKSIAEWAEIYQIHPETLRKRVRSGWDMEVALSKSPRPIKGVHY